MTILDGWVGLLVLVWVWLGVWSCGRVSCVVCLVLVGFGSMWVFGGCGVEVGCMNAWMDGGVFDIS